MARRRTGENPLKWATHRRKRRSVTGARRRTVPASKVIVPAKPLPHVSEMLPVACSGAEALAPMGSQDPTLTAEVLRLQTAPTIAVTLSGAVAVPACAGGVGVTSMFTNSVVPMATIFLIFTCG